MDPLTLALVTQLGQAGYRYFKSSQGLRDINLEAMPSVLESKAMAPYLENQRLAQKMGQLDPAAVRLAKQQQALESARNQRFFGDVGGGQLSSAASRLGALGTTQTALGLAGMQQAATQRGLAAQTSANMQLGQLYQQDVRNRLQQRMQQEQAYGMAKQQSFQDAIGAVGGYAMGMNANKQADLNRQFWKDLYGKDTVPTTTPTDNIVDSASEKTLQGFRDASSLPSMEEYKKNTASQSNTLGGQYAANQLNKLYQGPGTSFGQSSMMNTKFPRTLYPSSLNYTGAMNQYPQTYMGPNFASYDPYNFMGPLTGLEKFNK